MNRRANIIIYKITNNTFKKTKTEHEWKNERNLKRYSKQNDKQRIINPN